MQAMSIARYEARSAMALPSDSVKAQHLLPFLPSTVTLILRLEDLQAGMPKTEAGKGEVRPE